MTDCDFGVLLGLAAPQSPEQGFDEHLFSMLGSAAIQPKQGVPDAQDC
jgi:hypothetical protein